MLAKGGTSSSNQRKVAENDTKSGGAACEGNILRTRRWREDATPKVAVKKGRIDRVQKRGSLSSDDEISVIISNF